MLQYVIKQTIKENIMELSINIKSKRLNMETQEEITMRKVRNNRRKLFKRVALNHKNVALNHDTGLEKELWALWSKLS